MRTLTFALDDAVSHDHASSLIEELRSWVDVADAGVFRPRTGPVLGYVIVADAADIDEIGARLRAVDHVAEAGPAAGRGLLDG